MGSWDGSVYQGVNESSFQGVSSLKGFHCRELFLEGGRKHYNTFVYKWHICTCVYKCTSYLATAIRTYVSRNI